MFESECHIYKSLCVEMYRERKRKIMSHICHHGQPILNSKFAYNERPGIYARCNGDGNSNQKGDEDALKLRRSRIAHIDNVGVC
jgi:hypothetical protein